MQIILIILVAICLLTSSSASISLAPQEDTNQKLSTTSHELLSSFHSCIVYIFDWTWNSNYESFASRRYFLFFSNTITCAIIVDTVGQYRKNSAYNHRFDLDKIEPHPLFTKYTTALINLYSPTATSTMFKKRIPRDFFQFILAYNIPFSYVLVFMRKQDFITIDNMSMFSMFVKISSPAVLVLDEHEVNVVGFAHALRSLQFLFRVKRFQPVHFRHLHESIYRDLQGLVALTDVDSWKTCRFGEPVLQTPNMCTLEVIAAHFNVTFLGSTNSPGPRPDIVVSIFVINDVMGIYHFRLLSRRSKFNYDFVNYAVFYVEENFVCIAQVSNIGLIAFIRAYDLLTWVLTLTVCLCLSATIAAMVRNVTLPFLTRIQSAAPVVFMLLIERFYGYGQVIRSAPRQNESMVILWAFGAMLLGSCYSGNMISELTSPSLPECPHTMHELAGMQEYPVLTHRAIARNLSYGLINEYLVEQRETNGSLLEKLRQFGKALTFANKTQLFSARYNTSSKILVAFADTPDFVRAFGMIQLTHRERRVLTGGNLPFLTAMVPMMVQSNFLGPKFRRFLATLFECGMWDYWTNCYMANTVYRRLNTFANATLQEEKWKKQFKLAAIFRDFGAFVNDEASWIGLTLENLNAVFAFLGGCLLVAFCSFLNERWPWRVICLQLLTLAGYWLSVFSRCLRYYVIWLFMAVSSVNKGRQQKTIL